LKTLVNIRQFKTIEKMNKGVVDTSEDSELLIKSSGRMR
jgi:hypothetical protein